MMKLFFWNILLALLIVVGFEQYDGYEWPENEWTEKNFKGVEL